MTGFKTRAHSSMVAFLSTLAAAAVLLPHGATADDLIVKYDQSQLLRMPRQVSEIIIGNPSIADVSIQSSNLLVITGKSFGITNIIALDSERNVIQDQRVLVQRDAVSTINLQKGAKRESYNCSPQCNPSITVGDDPAYLQAVAADSEKKLKLSETQASGGSPAQ